MQLNFPFTNKNDDKFSEKKFLEKFFSQDDFDSTQFPIMILKGEKYSGKTHLLNIFANKYNAEFISKEVLNDNNPLNIFANNKFFIVDDFSEINDEERILALINSAVESKIFLLLADNNTRKFNLKDLNSRLKNIFSTEIKDPTTETMKILIANLLSNHQIKLSANQLDDIISNLPRSYSSIDLILKKINFFLLENGDKISKNNIAQIIK